MRGQGKATRLFLRLLQLQLQPEPGMCWNRLLFLVTSHASIPPPERPAPLLASVSFMVMHVLC